MTGGVFRELTLVIDCDKAELLFSPAILEIRID
jgi:hypothetical protein